MQQTDALEKSASDEGMLIIISGPSGSGKGTVVKGLCQDEGFALSISVTTRKPRVGEVDGKHYFFTTEEEFHKMRTENALLEHAIFVGNFYGTPKKYVEEQISEGKNVVLEIEVQGALQVRAKFMEAVLVFLVPPTIGELARRLRARGSEDDVSVEARLKKAADELPLAKQYNYIVLNDNLSQAIEEIKAIVTAERLRPSRRLAFLQNFL